MSKVYVYKTQLIDERTHSEDIEEILNEHAIEGWRLHTMVRRVRSWNDWGLPSDYNLLLTFEAKVDPSSF